MKPAHNENLLLCAELLFGLFFKYHIFSFQIRENLLYRHKNRCLQSEAPEIAGFGTFQKTTAYSINFLKADPKIK